MDPKSARSTTPWWLLLLTLFGSAFLAQRAAPNPSDKESAASSPTPVTVVAAGKDPTDRLLAPIRALLGLPESEQKQVAESANAAESADGAEKAQLSADALTAELQKQIGLLEFMIVLVADPIDTQTSHRFDLQIDTLHKALGTEEYVPDRFYLPWEAESDRAIHRQEPGVLLYRRNGNSLSTCANRSVGRSDLLVVYLVGETPTSGVHRQAFATAVIQGASLLKRLRCDGAEQAGAISVAGPVFSGSADSLAHAIHQVRHDDLAEASFEVITGSAISVDAERFAEIAGPNADMHATVLQGGILRQALIEHVAQRTLSGIPRIAWLTETGTGYGSRISFVDPRAEFKQQPRQTLWNTRQDGDAAPDQASPAEIVEFPFPANIARVRSVYAESRRRERSNQVSLGPERYRLPIPFADSNTARDVPPMQTPNVTAPTIELLLGQILSAIRNQGIKYVGISYTDPRDPIFLAELIKEQCPDVQIMLVTSDLLHLHSEYRSIMHGSLVASTYPLYPESLEWCFPYGEEKNGKSRSVVFSSQSYYGLYNAVVFLRGLQRRQYRHDQTGALVLNFHSDAAAEPVVLPLSYGLPFQKYADEKTFFHPPVWVSRIGPAGIHPITVRPTDGDEKPEWIKEKQSKYTLTLRIDEPRQSLPELTTRSRVPLSLRIGGMLWLVGAVLLYGALGWPRRMGNWAKPLSPEGSDRAEFRPLIRVFRSLITGAVAYVTMLFGSLLSAATFRAGIHSVGDGLIAAQWLASWLMVVILCGCMVLDLLRAFRRDPPAPPGNSVFDLTRQLRAAQVAGFLLILLLGALYFASAYWQLHLWKRHTVDGYLWFAMSSDMWNGLSMLLTAQFLTLSVILLSYGMLVQMHLLSAAHTIPPPFSPPDAPQAREEVRNALLFPLLDRWKRSRPIVLDLLCVFGALAWLGFLASRLQTPDFFTIPVNFSSVLLIFACAFWFVRFFKLIQILEYFTRRLEELADQLDKRWPASWQGMFKRHGLEKTGLQELLWQELLWDRGKRPRWNDERRLDAEQKLGALSVYEDPRPLEEKLLAIKIDLYVRQFFYHCARLALGLILSACLLFLTAQSFPFSSEPLLRLTASIMLAAAGCLIVWYYFKFDRDELLSRLVGTDPKQVSWNWSLFQSVAPGVLLAAIALVSQAFPEVWQWLRYVLEPMAHSSA